MNSSADITIGDYWAVSQKTDIIDTNEGISLVCISTIEGMDFMKNILNSAEIFAKKLSSDDVDASFISRYRDIPLHRGEYLTEFPMKPKLTVKDRIRKYYYEIYVRKLKIHR